MLAATVNVFYTYHHHHHNICKVTGIALWYFSDVSTRCISYYSVSATSLRAVLLNLLCKGGQLWHNFVCMQATPNSLHNMKHEQA